MQLRPVQQAKEDLLECDHRLTDRDGAAEVVNVAFLHEDVARLDAQLMHLLFCDELASS